MPCSPLPLPLFTLQVLLKYLHMFNATFDVFAIYLFYIPARHRIEGYYDFVSVIPETIAARAV